MGVYQVQQPKEGSWLISISYLRKGIIATFVAAHFLFGILATLSPQIEIRRQSPIAKILTWYEETNFYQNWVMFAPPPQTKNRLAYAARFADGWTELIFFDEDISEAMKGRHIIPRGLARLGTMKKVPVLKKGTATLDENPGPRFFFQQLSAYLCFGDGALPDLQEVMFYRVSGGIEPYFQGSMQNMISDLKELPPKEAYAVVPLFRRECSER
jgi:hypothetical protein